MVRRLEVILAVLAVIVWHFYYVIINLDESPMALTWITGRISREELELLHLEEHEEPERREWEAKDEETGGQMRMPCPPAGHHPGRLPPDLSLRGHPRGRGRAP